MKLTPQQRNALTVILQLELDARPRLPTVREVAEAMGCGPSLVAYHLHALRRHGLVMPQEGRWGLLTTAKGRREARRA